MKNYTASEVVWCPSTKYCVAKPLRCRYTFKKLLNYSKKIARSGIPTQPPARRHTPVRVTSVSKAPTAREGSRTLLAPCLRYHLHKVSTARKASAGRYAIAARPGTKEHRSNQASLLVSLSLRSLRSLKSLPSPPSPAPSTAPINHPCVHGRPES